MFKLFKPSLNTCLPLPPIKQCWGVERRLWWHDLCQHCSEGRGESILKSHLKCTNTFFLDCLSPLWTGQLLRCVFVYNFLNVYPIFMKFAVHEAFIPNFNTKCLSLHFNCIYLGSGHFFIRKSLFFCPAGTMFTSICHSKTIKNWLYFILKTWVKNFWSQTCTNIWSGL